MGVGKGPTGTSIRVGPSRRAKAARSAARSILRAPRSFAGCAEALGEFDEIRVGQVAGDQAIAELLLLDAADIAEGAIVEHDAISGMRWRTAVAISLAVNMKPPSPVIETTGTSRQASWAPSAVAKPQPRLS